MVLSNDIIRFFNDVRMRVPGAVDPAIQQEFFQVVDEFLRYTNAWQETIPFSALDTTTTCLLHLNGPDFSTQTFPTGLNTGTVFAESFNDSSGSNLRFTPGGHTRISQSQFKFGGSSAYFDGSANTFLTTPPVAALQPTGDYTIDFWTYPTGTPGATFYGMLGNTGNLYAPYFIYIDTGNRWRFFASSTGSSWDIAVNVDIGAVTYNAWQHIAIERVGNTYNLFNNGVLISTFSSSATPIALSGLFQLGGSGGGNLFIGYVDEFHFSMVARYPATGFTPATAPYAQPPFYPLVPFDASATINRLMFLFDSSGNPKNGVLFQPGNPTTLQLTTLPTTQDTYSAIVALTVVDPVDSNNNVVFPNWILTKYRQDFMDGVVGRLMSQQKKPYTNEKMSVYHLRRWRSAMTAAKVEVQRLNKYGGQAWFYPQSYRVGRQKFVGSETRF